MSKLSDHDAALVKGLETGTQDDLQALLARRENVAPASPAEMVNRLTKAVDVLEAQQVEAVKPTKKGK